MADERNYIGVAMGLDVSDLKAGLADANKQIQLANSEFKAASSGMDDWTKSTAGLTAKVKQLDTVLGAQKAKLAGLQAEYEKVAREQGEGSEAARRLKVQINNQQAVVNKTQKEFDNYTETLKQAEAGTIDLSTATIQANGKIKDFGNGAKGASDNVKGGFGKAAATGIVAGIASIGAAAVGVVGSFLSLAESTREARENFNKLETGFTTAGHSAEDAQATYKELYGILGDEGQATEAAAHLAQLADNQEDLAKWTDISAGVYATFGDSLPIENLTEAANETAKTGKITGGLADALNWAGESEEEFQAKLDAASSEQERQALITETLNGLYSDQSAKFKELNADVIQAREADAALTQAMAELGAVAEPIMTMLKTLAADLLNEMQPFVELIGTGLKGAFEGTAGSADILAEGIGGVLGSLVSRITDMLPTLVSVLSSLIPTLFETIYEQVPALLDTLTDLIPQFANAIFGMMPQFVPIVADLVTQLVDAIVILLPQLITAIIDFVPQMITALLAEVPQLLQAAITLLMAIVDAVPLIITSLVAVLPTIVTAIIDAILQAFPLLIDAAIQLFMAIIDAIPVIIQALVTNLPKIITAIIDGVLNALPLLLDAAVKLLMAIVDAIPKIIPPLITMMPKIISSIVSTLSKNFPKILTAAFDMFLGIVKAIPKILVELVKSIPEIITTIVTSLGEGYEQMATAGLDLLKGIWEGIKGGATWLKDKITGFAGDVAGWFKDTFKISSPSKLMEDEVGVYVGQGVVPSSPRALAKVKKSLGKFTNYVSDNLGDIKGNLALDGAGGSGGVSAIGGSRNTVINAGMTVNYNGNLSRKELKRMEIDNYIAIRTKLKAEGAI